MHQIHENMQLLKHCMQYYVKVDQISPRVKVEDHKTGQRD